MSTIAFEVPFTFVGAVFLGGLIGYYLDRWLQRLPGLWFYLADLVLPRDHRNCSTIGPGAPGIRDDNTKR